MRRSRPENTLSLWKRYGRSKHDGRPDLPAVLFFPSTPDLSQATWIDLQKGTQQSGDFLLNTVDPGHVVSGLQVPAPSGGTIGLFSESQDGLEYRLPIHASVAKDGAFHFDGVPRGIYTLRGRGFNGSTEYNAETTVSVRSQDVKSLRLTYLPQREMELYVNTPVDSAQPTEFVMEDVSTGHRAHLKRIDPRHFHVSELVSGSYALSPEGAGNTCIRQIALDGREAVLPMPLAPDAVHGHVDVETTQECFGFRGTLETQHAGAVVLTDAKMQILRTLRANRQGQFVVNGLQPGQYRVFAWPTIENVPFRNPALLREHMAQSVEVTVEEQGRIDPIHLQVIGG